ncbi:hypothetical protein DSCA_18550 [Desulfosarcina alkanivorans]|uniref:MCM C-terminal AAA(+) ATPase domain-containing protein n=1 Tax=Desulfosarcina alkanivorans TaxID=571177 RepID=A0A5K7YHP3_9BACT|nr:hypothetical protein [Desulfosarcina alkanivorans]BBO67925.1 hypothetical protein DSCA_18550 [Desulfosarcina alkanivorans]
MVVNFRHRPYSTASDILIKPDRIVVKLWGRIEDIELPYKVGEDRTANAVKSKATIRDLEDNLIDTVEFSEKHFQKLIQMQKNAEPVELLCEIAPYKFEPNKWRNRLYVLAAASGASPLSRTQPSDADLKKVEAYLLRASTGFQLLGEIREAVCEKTATVLSSDSYREAVDLIILQSLSGGFVGKSNGKIHSCIIGAPGIGKGQLVEIIKLLNPIFEESQAERINDVGLTGRQKDFGGLWGVVPGKLPKANLGIFVIQDFDKCNDKSTVFNIFNYVMEEGKIIVTGAADVTNAAAASIHIDMNRKSHLYANRIHKGAPDDIDLPSNIISRFDYINELVGNIKDQNKRGRNIIKARSRSKGEGQSKIAKYCKENEIDIDRFLKILTAYIRTEYEHINLTPVSNLIRKKYSRLLKENADIPNLSNDSGRLFTSIQKFVVAATRVQLRKRANQRAVRMAVRMAGRKLDFLRQSQATPTIIKAPGKGKRAFAKWLFDKYGSDTFSPKKTIKRYREEGDPCGYASNSTLLNWIRYAADKVKHNQWKIKEEIMRQH